VFRLQANKLFLTSVVIFFPPSAQLVSVSQILSRSLPRSYSLLCRPLCSTRVWLVCAAACMFSPQSLSCQAVGLAWVGGFIILLLLTTPYVRALDGTYRNSSFIPCVLASQQASARSHFAYFFDIG
jgi:hypothetical protein